MLLLLFYLGEERFALDTDVVLEVLPPAELRQLPHAPAYVTGIFRHAGRTVPVIDLCQLVKGRFCAPRLSTRLILVRYANAAGESHALGLLAERVTETVTRDPADMQPAGISVTDAPYLGPLVADAQGLIQVVEVEPLLPQSLRDSLFVAEGA